MIVSPYVSAVKSAHKSPTASNLGMVAYDNMILWVEGSASRTSGNTLLDLSGLRCHGQIVGAVWGVTPAGGSTLLFDGVDDYVDGYNPVSAALAGCGGATVCHWARLLGGFGVIRALLFLAVSATAVKVLTFFSSGNGFAAQARAVSTDTAQTRVSVSTFTTSAWVHLTAVINIANDSIALYTNGSLIASTGTTSWTPTAFSNEVGTRSTIGISTDLVQYQFNGNINDLRVYNRVLTAGEIADIYALTKGNYGH